MQQQARSAEWLLPLARGTVPAPTSYWAGACSLSRCQRHLGPQVAKQLVEVVGQAPERPFAVHLLEAAQQEAPQTSAFLDLAKDGFDDRLLLRRSLRLAPGVNLPSFLLAQLAGLFSFFIQVFGQQTTVGGGGWPCF